MRLSGAADAPEEEVGAVVNMNLVVLVGRLVGDPELKYVDDGTAVANFSIAVNRRVRKAGGDEFENALDGFFDCELFGLETQTMKETLGKGAEVQLVGSLRQRKYETKGANPRTLSKVEIRVATIGRVLLPPPRPEASPEEERAELQPA